MCNSNMGILHVSPLSILPRPVFFCFAKSENLSFEKAKKWGRKIMMGFFWCVLVSITHQVIKITSFINIIFLQIHCAECPFSVSQVATTRFHLSTLTFVICRGKSSLQKATGEASDEVLGQSTPPPFNSELVLLAFGLFKHFFDSIQL